MIQTERRVADHRQKLDSGELTARQLAELYLGRIEAVDKDGPHLNSIIELNPEALEIAEMLGAELQKKKKRREALHGIPILIKDNIDTRDRMQTTAGSLALEGSFAAQDAFLAIRLRRAGAALFADRHAQSMRQAGITS